MSSVKGEYPARLDAIDWVSDQEDPGIVPVYLDEPDVVAFTTSLDNIGVLNVLPELSSPLHGRAPRIFPNEPPQCSGISPPRRLSRKCRRIEGGTTRTSKGPKQQRAQCVALACLRKRTPTPKGAPPVRAWYITVS